VRAARRVLLVLLAAWLVAWVVHAWRLGRSREATASAYVARGYAETVALFATHGWLTYDAAEDRILTTFAAGSPMEEFYRKSYLEEDVRRFNDGDRAVFRVENGIVLEVDPNLHNVVLPFTVPRPWTGLLTYRPEALPRGELRGAGVVAELRGPSRTLLEQDVVPAVVVGVPAPNGEKVVQAEAVNLEAPGGFFFGKAHLVGRAVVFNHRQQRDLPRLVEVSGESVPQGNRARIDAGDLLKLSWSADDGARRYALLWNTSPAESPVMSWHSFVNGSWRRTPAFPQPPFAGDLVTALDAAFLPGPGGRPAAIAHRRGFDLALTLDERMHRRAQAILDAHCRRLREPGEPPFRGAVAIMDALTGEMLALASHPAAEDVGGLEDTGARHRLLRNHNFARRPVGSVAKPLLAAAIVSAAPVLADLRILGYVDDEIPSVLGVVLHRPLRDHAVPGGADGAVDFEEFLEKSSNRYAAVLLSLATAASADGSRLLPPRGDPGVPEQLPPSDVFWMGAARHDRRPPVRLALVSDEATGLARSERLTLLEHEPHALALQRLFGVPISRSSLEDAPDRESRRRAPGLGDDLVDTSAWLPLLEFLYGPDRVPRNHTLFAVSPERENLAYNLAGDYRRDYLSVILGGATSTWTPLRLCEAFSRLVTGRGVSAQLVKRIRAADGTVEPAPAWPSFDMEPALRQRLADALSLVAAGGGTAGALDPLLREWEERLAPDGLAVGFFSKTGSPTVPMTEPTRLALAVNELIRRDALRLGPDGLIHYRDTGAVDADRPEEADVRRAWAALRAHAEDRAVLDGHGVSARSVVRACDRYNDAAPEDRPLRFEVRSGRLVRMLQRRSDDSIGGAYVFTAGVWKAAARRARTRASRAVDVSRLPQRAYTVAVLVESQGNGPTVAVPLARELMTGVIWEALREAR
jgi:hypothetical protein